VEPFDNVNNPFDKVSKNFMVEIGEEIKKTNSTNPNSNIKMLLDQYNKSEINRFLLNSDMDDEADMFFNKILDANNKVEIKNILTNIIVVLEKLKTKCDPPVGVKK
jgi:hypothetical protein